MSPAAAGGRQTRRRARSRVPRDDPRLLGGIARFNAGDYFESHEIWEALWHEVAGPERRFLQGLIQLAAAYHHRGRGNRRGALELHGKAREKLSAWAPRHAGIAVADLLAQAERDLASSGVTWGRPRLRPDRRGRVFRLVVYDLDGTLVDTRRDIVRAVNHTLWALGLPARPAPRILRFVGRGLEHLLRGSMGADHPARVSAAMRAYREYYAAHMLDHSRLYPSVRALLAHFAGRAQAVLSNKPDPFTREILTALGVAGRFREIIAGPYARKPDPAALEAVMARSGASPEETLMVGDSGIDIETGRRAGAATVALRHGLGSAAELRAARPDWLLHDAGELLALAKRAAW
ncbi:MAG TPA: HAD-IA family hydrolase [bacterium]